MRTFRTPGGAQLPPDRADRCLDHLVPAAPAHQVPAHHLQVFRLRLQQHHLDPGLPEHPCLVAEAATRRRAHERLQAFDRVSNRNFVQRRRGVQADHDVEALGADDVEVRGRVNPPVDVAAAGDRDRVIEARDRARGGHGVGEIRLRRIVTAEDDALAAGIVAGDHPEPRMARPTARHGAPDRVPQRPGRDHPTRKPGAEVHPGRVPERISKGLQSEPPRSRPDRRKRPLETEDRAPAAVGLLGRSALGIDEAVEPLARGVRDHEPGRHARCAQRTDHGAGRSPDHAVCAGRVPARLVGERVQCAREPCAAHHAARAEHQSHARTPGRTPRGPLPRSAHARALSHDQRPGGRPRIVPTRCGRPGRTVMIPLA